VFQGFTTASTSTQVAVLHRCYDAEAPQTRYTLRRNTTSTKDKVCV